MKIGWP